MLFAVQKLRIHKNVFYFAKAFVFERALEVTGFVQFAQIAVGAFFPAISKALQKPQVGIFADFFRQAYPFGTDNAGALGVFVAPLAHASHQAYKVAQNGGVLGNDFVAGSDNAAGIV